MTNELDFDALKKLALTHNDSSYADVVTQVPYSYYVERVKDLDLKNQKVVVDVGCGFGQWSAALAQFNDNVIGIDINKNRVEIGNALLKEANISNAKLNLGNALNLELEDQSVDIVFCYGVVMFVDFAKAIKEFRRVLKTGGLLYINSNGKGWWFNLAKTHFCKNKNVRNAALKGFLMGHLPAVTPNSSSLKTIGKKMRNLGFEIISKGYDGTITSDPKKFVDRQFYKPNKYGIWDNVIEHLSKKVI